MKIFAISDLHLPGQQDKPMDVFGAHWKNHWGKIKENWIEAVSPQDIVLIPGDISWAMTLEEALVDLNDIATLPGNKIMIKGNHDYWWSSISRLRDRSHHSIYTIQNDSISLEDFPGLVFCGTRGWTAPGAKDFTEHDQKIFNREVSRLKLSLDAAKGAPSIIVLLHFPPFDDKGQESEICHLIKQYPVKHVVFGHLHGDSLKGVIEGKINGVTYHLVSCDYLDFIPKLIEKL
ncbi:MAG: serine/threonine protein phosphatase [Clostridiales bacterium]|nr:serine/threonine protein phosphatase [Clostridiales bacterium]